MKIFEKMDFYGHEQVVFARDPKVGLKAIIAVHDTTLGPALGGTRFWNYASEEEALFDVMRLSQGMTMKNAAADLPLGGGKAVIIGDPKALKSEEFFKSYAGFINSLGGKYYTAEDMNTNTNDIDTMKKYTDYVVGTSAVSSDPSPYTAKGVFEGIRAGLEAKYGSDSFAGKVVSVQGLGSVGYVLCQLLHAAGAKLKVFDLDAQKVAKATQEFGAEVLSMETILTDRCDILAPCAMGAVINENNVNKLQCDIVGGSANNILSVPAIGDELKSKDILYLPDYIVNAGGVINCGAEQFGKYNQEYIMQQVNNIYNTTKKVIEIAKQQNIATNKAADEYALSKIAAGKK